MDIILFTIFECSVIILAVYCSYKGCKQDVGNQRVERTFRATPALKSENVILPPHSFSEISSASEAEPPPYVTVVNA